MHGLWKMFYWPKTDFLLAVFIAAAIALSALPANAKKTPDANGLYWGDADSGEFHGKPFRLYSVDAPETGPVGSKSGARCIKERKLGYIYRNKMRELTAGAKIGITHVYGDDGLGRELVDLAFDGQDVSAEGKRLGILAPWPFNIRKPLAPKPDWCR